MPYHAGSCVMCGACEKRCPYGLPIRDMLEGVGQGVRVLNMGRWDMGWDTLLVMYAPFLLGLAAFALIALAVWPRPPRWVRVSAGVLGSALLLWALWAYVFRPVFAP